MSRASRSLSRWTIAIGVSIVVHAVAMAMLLNSVVIRPPRLELPKGSVGPIRITIVPDDQGSADPNIAPIPAVSAKEFQEALAESGRDLAEFIQRESDIAQRIRTETRSAVETASRAVLGSSDRLTGVTESLDALMHRFSDQFAESPVSEGSHSEEPEGIQPPMPAKGNPAPKYPAASLRRREEGTVYLHAVIERDGTPHSIELVRSSGHPGLDRAALKAVKNWSFHPAVQAGVPVRADIDIPLVFVIRESGQSSEP